MKNKCWKFITDLDSQIDSLSSRLKKKEWVVPSDLLGGVIFLVFGLLVLWIIPQEIEIKKKEIVNGQAFPKLLMYIMIGCSILLIIEQLIKIIRKVPVKTVTINLLVEVKALLMFLAMVLFYIIAENSGNFALGACLFGLMMLLIFRCKKPLYYFIVMAAGIIIWSAFRFGLGVLF